MYFEEVILIQKDRTCRYFDRHYNRMNAPIHPRIHSKTPRRRQKAFAGGDTMYN